MVAISHRFQSTKADAADSSLVRSSDWNNDHDITLSQRAIIGRLLTGSGTAAEVLLGLDDDDSVPTRGDIKIHYGMRSIAEFGVDITGATDSADALDDMIAQINAGTLNGGIMVPPESEIAVSRPLIPIQQGGWVIGCVLGNTASFVLQRDDATSYGRIFQIGVAAVARVSGWGFQNITIENANWRTDTGSQWGLEVVYAAQGVLWNVDFQNCGWKHGAGTSNGGKCTWHNVSFTLNKSLPQAGIQYAYASGVTVYDGNATAIRRNMCDGLTDITVSNAGVASTVLPNFMPLLAGWTYKAEFTVSGYSSGSVTPQLTGGGTVSGSAITANGDYEVSLVAGAGNNCFSFAASSTAQLQISGLKVSRAGHADFRAMKLGPEMAGGNIDSLDFHGFKCNVPQDTDVPYSLEIDCSYDDIGSVLFDTCYFELAVEGAILIHSRNAATGFMKGVTFKDCRASPQKNRLVSAIHVDNVNDVPIQFDWNGGQINGARTAPSVLIEATSASARHDIRFNGVQCQDRSGGNGVSHPFFEVATGGVQVLNSALVVDYDNDTGIEYSSMIDKFVYASADIPDLIVCNNRMTKATAAEAIDLSSVTTLYTSTAKFSVHGNVGATRHLIVPGATMTPSDGAAPGDGTTDDGLSLQKVLDANKPILLDHGRTYYIKSRLTLGNGATIIGDGSQTLVMDLDSFTNSDRTLYSSATAALIYSSGKSKIRLRDFKIIPSIQDGGYIRIPISNITKAGGANVVVTCSSVSQIRNGQKVTLYGITGADEVDSDTLAGAANATEYTITARNTGANTFELSGTSAVVLTPYVSGGYVEPKRFPGIISLRSSSDIVIDNVEITGFAVGYGIALDTCTDVLIIPNIHDWKSSYCFDTASQAQATAIAVDGSRVGNVGSTGIRIVDGAIYNLTKIGAGAYSQDSPTSKRYQTDAIGIGGTDSTTSTPTVAVTVSGMRIDSVDEGIDCFGTVVSIGNNQITNCFSHAVKLIYVPRHIVIDGNVLGPTGRDNVTINAASVASSDDNTRGIIISNNHFLGIETNEFPGNSCLVISDSGPSTSLRSIKDVISVGNTYDPGTYGNYIVDYAGINYDGNFSSKGDHFVKSGTLGWFARSNFRKLGIKSISKTNPAVVTLIDSTDPTLLQWVANSGQIIYIRNVLGMTQIPDGYYKMGSARVGAAFDLADINGTLIDSSAYSTYTGGGTVQNGSQIQISEPHHKTIAKLTLLSAQTIAAATLSATFEFKAVVYDHRNEVDAANNGLKVQLPGFYRVTCMAHTTGNTPSGATEETKFQINVTGPGNVITKYFTPRATQSLTYDATGVVWCDTNDIITANIVFIANAAGVTFSADHTLTYLAVEML